mmetsp:Transcript_10909/g.21119  ORF Transcript_10909/g.21119 Transcript_10909/m.21119 type:complete len:207 (+) Transcript_10909:296-916(+)
MPTVEDVSWLYVCPLCNKSTYHTEAYMCISVAKNCNPDKCRFCSTCLDNLFPTETSTLNKCPTCGRHSVQKGEYVQDTMGNVTKEERRALTHDQEASKRVADVFNKVRTDFPTTPEYNQELEYKAELIYTLSFGTEQERSKASHELEMYAKEHDRDIKERAQRLQKEREGRIKHIVNAEGVFYEKVKLPPVWRGGGGSRLHFCSTV